jgi:hypothetical protein
MKANWEVINRARETRTTEVVDLLPKEAVIKALANLADEMDEAAGTTGLFIGFMDVNYSLFFWDVLEVLGMSDDEKEAVLGEKLYAHVLQVISCPGCEE